MPQTAPGCTARSAGPNHWVRARLLPLILIYTFTVTILRAIQMPNDYACAQWLYDYRFGFMKRGLAGALGKAVASVMGLPMSRNLIAIYSAIAYVAFSAAFLFVLWRVVRKHEASPGTLVAALAFAASPFVVMSAHIFGYFDIFLYAFAIASVGLILRGRLWPAAILQAIAVLIHENYILIGFPWACLASFMAITRADRTRPVAIRHLLAQSLPIIFFLALLVYHTFLIDNVVLRNHLAAYLEPYPFVQKQRWGAAFAQTTGFFEFFRQQHQFFWGRFLNPTLFLSVWPVTFTLIYLAHARARVAPFSLVSLMLLAGCFAPLCLHAVAYDTARISTFLIGGALIGFWILSETLESSPLEDYALLLAIPALLLAVFTRIPLMDNLAERFSLGVRWLLYGPTFLFTLYVILRGTKSYSATRP